MARLAATEHGADWVINERRRRVLVAARRLAARRCSARSRGATGIVQSLVRHFVPVADDGRPFQERMTLPARRDGADQRSREPVAAVPEGRPPGGTRRRARRGRARRPRHRAAAAARLVPDRVPPLPASHRPPRSSGRGRPGAMPSRSSTRPRRSRGRRARRTTRSSTRPRRGARSPPTTRLSRSPPTSSPRGSRPACSPRTRASATRSAAVAEGGVPGSPGPRRSTRRRSPSRRPCCPRRTSSEPSAGSTTSSGASVGSSARRRYASSVVCAPSPAGCSAGEHARRDDPRREGRGRSRRRLAALPPGAGRRPGDRHRSSLDRRDERGAARVRARRQRSRAPRGCGGLAAGRMGDADGPARCHRARGRLGR